MEEGFTDDLDAWLKAVQDRYEVERTLKRTPTEVTEVVWRLGSTDRDRSGPFVRKTFMDGDRGSAYVDVFHAQTKGCHLAHQPFLYECERTDNVLQVVMEYVEGLNLKELVAREGPSEGLCRSIMGEVCDAASELHESLTGPIIHRDIKPTNIMVRGDSVVLIDLGISRVWREQATRDTVRLGTPGYAPPEQYGYGQTSIRSDVFALGMTCAFCLTGEDPDQALAESGFRHPAITERVAAVLSRACAFDPTMRHASARELKRDLMDALSEEPAGRRTSWSAVRAAPASQPVERGEEQRCSMLGIIWNVVVCLAWVIILVGCIGASAHPYGSLARQPRLYTAAQYLFAFVIPVACIGYLLLDKRGLRRRIPELANLTWRVELPICLAIGIGSFFLALVSIVLSATLFGT